MFGVVFLVEIDLMAGVQRHLGTCDQTLHLAFEIKFETRQTLRHRDLDSGLLVSKEVEIRLHDGRSYGILVRRNDRQLHFFQERKINRRTIDRQRRTNGDERFLPCNQGLASRMKACMKRIGFTL